MIVQFQIALVLISLGIILVCSLFIIDLFFGDFYLRTALIQGIAYLCLVICTILACIFFILGIVQGAFA